MRIVNLFQYAEIIRDQAWGQANFISHFGALVKASTRLIDGYQDLRDAESETNVRFDAWGFEIDPSAVADAVNFKRWLASQKIEVKNEDGKI